MQGCKVIPLFGFTETINTPSARTLYTPFSESKYENYKRASIRLRILDYQGALIYFTKCTAQDKIFADAYLNKGIIYFTLEQYNNAALNLLKYNLTIKVQNQFEHIESDLLVEFLELCDKSQQEIFFTECRKFIAGLRHLDTTVDCIQHFLDKKIFTLDRKTEPLCSNDFLDLKEI